MVLVRFDQLLHVPLLVVLDFRRRRLVRGAGDDSRRRGPNRQKTQKPRKTQNTQETQKTQELQDTVKDVKQAIEKKKDWLELVSDRKDADIVLQVANRDIKGSGRFESTSTSSTSNNGKYTSRSANTREIMLYTVQAVMWVGDYKNQFVGTIQDTYLLGGLWRTAANDVAGQLEKWVKTNYAKLKPTE